MTKRRRFGAFVTGALVLSAIALADAPRPGPADAGTVASTVLGRQVTERYAEQRYLGAIMQILDESIRLRAGMDAALRSGRPAGEQRRLLDEFRVSHLGFLIHLRELGPSPRLVPFHQQIRAALLEQSAFYGTLVGGRLRDVRVGAAGTSRSPGAEFSAALEHVRRLTSALDRRAARGLEERLRQLN